MNARHTPSAARDPGHGRTQRERAPVALDPRSAPVDERPPAYFLAFAAEYARLLNFHELDGSVSGDWRHFLDVDISFLLAQLNTIPDQDELFATSRLLRRWRWRGDDAALQDVIGHAYRMLHRIDGWRARVAALDNVGTDPLGEHGMLLAYLESMIREKLSGHVDAVLADPGWHRCWVEAQRRADGENGENGDDGGSPWYRRGPWLEVRGADTAPPSLDRILKELNAANGDLKAWAGLSLERTLGDFARHPPHTALFIAFVQLLQALRADVNRFTERHLDHYYRDILRLRERAGQPDRGHVMFKLAPAFDSHFLPRGSRLGAGKDGTGADIVYATDADIEVNRGAVVSLRTLYFARAPAPAGQAGWIRQAFAAPVANSADGLGRPLDAPERGWQAFGRLDEQHFSNAAGLRARFGIVISSQVLLMAQGKRHVKLGFTFDRHKLADVGAQLVREMGGVGAPSWRRVCRAGLRIALSGAGQWIGVERFFLRARADGTGIDMRFTLAADQPAVLANAALEGGVDSGWPMLRIVLDPDAAVYPYSALAQLALHRVDIEVDVRGLENLRLSGRPATGKPFFPFGGRAASGACLDVWHEELAKPQLRRVDIEIDWANLPAGADAFAAYYAGYGEGFDARPFDTAAYGMRLARYSGRRWLGVAQDRVFPLYPGTMPARSGAPALVTRLRFTPPQPDPAPHAAQDAAKAGAAGVPGLGTVRIALAAPPCGFGHELYPRALVDQAMRNAARLQFRAGAKNAQSAPVELEPTLRPPLVPTAQALRCAYVAGDSVVLAGPAQAGGAKLFALGPFGARALPQDSRVALCDDDGYDGRLYIGLSGLRPPQTLSLHFQLREKSAALFALARDGQAAAADPPIAWRYLAGDVWRDFPARQPRSATDDLSRSGIVTFALPRELNDDNSVMPAGLFWIEARARGATADRLAVDILAQAVAVTRCCGDAGAPESLPAQSIKALLNKTPAVAALLQPYATSGGGAKETPAQLRVRVSERLKHKQRASQPGDYEQLALDAFAGLRQVKCITFNNSRGFPPAARVAAGEVVLALVPAGPAGGAPAPAAASLLSAVAVSLQRRSAAAVRRITVRNCEYEQVKVFANLEFQPGCDVNAALALLDAAISASLAPWLSDPAAPLDIGCGQVDARQIADLIRRQPCVKRSSAILVSRLRQTAQGDTLDWIREPGVALLSTPWSVFMPAGRHGLQAGDAGVAPGAGIGSLTVNADLVVAMDGQAGVDGRGGAAPAAQRYYLALPAGRAAGAADGEAE